MRESTAHLDRVCGTNSQNIYYLCHICFIDFAFVDEEEREAARAKEAERKRQEEERKRREEERQRAKEQEEEKPTSTF